VPSRSGELPDGGVSLEQDEPLEACPHCSRTFRAKVLARHVGICEKVFIQKRAAFDAGVVPAEAQKAKRAAEKMEKQSRKQQGGRKSAAPEEEALPKAAAWKQKSEAFRAAIKNARVVDKYIKEGRPLSELPAAAPTPAELDDRTPCPHCGRRFGQQQATRHIPLCPQNKAAKKRR